MNVSPVEILNPEGNPMDIVCLHHLEVYFDVAWRDLEKTLIGLLTLADVSRQTWKDSFVNIYRLCNAMPESLADRLLLETNSFLVKHVKVLLDRVKNHSSEENVIDKYHKEWKKYREGLTQVNDLYMYLNVQHIRMKKTSEAEIIYGNCRIGIEQMEIEELGLEIWRRNMIEPLQTSLVPAILECLHRDRKAYPPSVDACVVRETVESFCVVGKFRKQENKNNLVFYKTYFEEALVNSCAEYFRAKKNHWRRKWNVITYSKCVIQLFEDESARSKAFLPPCAHDTVKQCCVRCMIEEYLSTANEIAYMTLLGTVPLNMLQYVSNYKDLLMGAELLLSRDYVPISVFKWNFPGRRMFDGCFKWLTFNKVKKN